MVPTPTRSSKTAFSAASAILAEHQVQPLVVLGDEVGEGLDPHRVGLRGDSVVSAHRAHIRRVHIRRRVDEFECARHVLEVPVLDRRLAVHGAVVHGDGVAGSGIAQGDSEHEISTLVGGHVVDDEIRRDDVGYGAHPGGAAGGKMGLHRVAQLQLQLLVSLGVVVMHQVHRDGFLGRARREAQHVAGQRGRRHSRVVVARISRIGRAGREDVVHLRRIARAGVGQAHREGLRGALAALEAHHRQRGRQDVCDGADPVDLAEAVVAVAAEQDCSARVRERQAQRLVGLGQIVAHQLHRHLDLGGASSSEGERARQQVQRVRRRCPEIVDRCGRVGPGVADDVIDHRHILARTGTAQTGGEGLRGALGSAEAVHGQHRRGVVEDGAHRVGLVDGVAGVAVEQFGVGARTAQHQMERLGILEQIVVHQHHRHLDLGVASRGEGERARQQVQRVRRRCPEIVDCCGRVGPGVADDVVLHGHVLGEHRR